MTNAPEIYRQSGYKAGKARYQRDESRAKFEADWYRAAMAMETTYEDKMTAKTEWEAGYREGNPQRAPEYFR